jgi:multidrug resistance efflux pump
VVQRLNVRIELDNVPADLPLAIGLMANVTVDTHPNASNAKAQITKAQITKAKDA